MTWHPNDGLCYCGHHRSEHDFDADFDGVLWQSFWGVCEVKDCKCPKFRDVEYDDTLTTEEVL